MLILQEGGNRGNWGEWRVFGGIIWRDQHFCQCSFFRALPTYSDGILHIPVHVLVFREYPRIFPSRRSYPPDIPPCDRLVSKWGQTSQPKARTNKRRLYCHGHSARIIKYDVAKPFLLKLLTLIFIPFPRITGFVSSLP